MLLPQRDAGLDPTMSCVMGGGKTHMRPLMTVANWLNLMSPGRGSSRGAWLVRDRCAGCTEDGLLHSSRTTHARKTSVVGNSSRERIEHARA